MCGLPHICSGLVASAAAGFASLCVGVADREAGTEVGVVDELDETGLECVHRLLVAEEVESFLFDDELSLSCLLLEGHSELRSGACHACEVDLDTVADLVVLLEKVVDELLCIRCYCNHVIISP